VQIEDAAQVEQDTTEQDEQAGEFVFDIYETHEPIPEGYHAGTITGLKSLGKRITPKHGEKDEIAIVVTLDKRDANDTPVECDVVVNRTIKEGSNLRKVLIKLRFPPDNKRFDLACIKGLKVDVYVTHKKGKIPGVSFAEVDWKHIDLPGRRSRIQVTRVNDRMKDGAR